MALGATGPARRCPLRPRPWHGKALEDVVRGACGAPGSAKGLCSGHPTCRTRRGLSEFQWVLSQGLRLAHRQKTQTAFLAPCPATLNVRGWCMCGCGWRWRCARTKNGEERGSSRVSNRPAGPKFRPKFTPRLASSPPPFPPPSQSKRNQTPTTSFLPVKPHIILILLHPRPAFPFFRLGDVQTVEITHAHIAKKEHGGGHWRRGASGGRQTNTHTHTHTERQTQRERERQTHTRI